MAGGNINEYRTLFLADSFAEVQRVMASYAKAADEAKLAPMPEGVVLHAERATFRYIPELSIEPAQRPAAK
jgi:hypothetical protein